MVRSRHSLTRLCRLKRSCPGRGAALEGGLNEASPPRHHDHGGHGACAPSPTLRAAPARGARGGIPAKRLHPSCCNEPSINRGRRESRMPVAPAAWRAEDESTPAKSPQVQPDRSGLPRASGFNGFLRDLLGEPGFLATVACGKPAGLIPASGYRDDTTSPSASAPFVSRHLASIASRAQRP
jgi:hypothetical protein